MSSCRSSSGFEFVNKEKVSDGAGSLWSLITQSHLRLINLQKETEREISHVSYQLRSVRLQQKILNCETADQETLQAEAEHLQSTVKFCKCFPGSECDLQRCVLGKTVHTERLQFREQALVALLSMLGENFQRYKEETTKLDHLSEKLTNGMPGMNQMNGSMETNSKDILRSSENNGTRSNGHIPLKEEEKKQTANKKTPIKMTNLMQAGGVKDLIHKFTPINFPSDLYTSKDQSKTEAKSSPDKLNGEAANAKDSGVPAVEVTPPSGASKKVSGGPNTVSDSKPNFHFDQEREPASPASEGTPTTPKPIQSPKYRMFLASDMTGNGASGPGGPIGTSGNGMLTKSNLTHWKSMESLSPKDWDTKTGTMENPPRVFNSPYATLSLDYNPPNRVSEYKMPLSVSPNTSEMNLYTLTRSTSPVTNTRIRYPAYDTLTRRREQQTTQTHFLLRNNQPNKRDYIEELTRQLEDSQRRNQFLEAESVELEKERTQIRFEMRNLLVNNEDLVRMNTQLQGELIRMRERIVELESTNNVMVERFKQLEVELKEAREVMVEANTQEYAFNFLQQSLKNKIQDAEEALEKQTQRAQELAEKLWLAERNLEELEIEKDTKGKKAGELRSTVERLESELAEALQQASQSTAELNLQQKLRIDIQLRVEELEECVLEKDQEITRLQQIINRLQGDVSDKLMDKEHMLEQEIQLREKFQLQCKQAERALEDLQMELQTMKQNREDLSKQLKVTQETVIDLETDLEEMQENEQRLINKQKRAVEQYEQMQMKLIQEKDLNDKLECEKVILERQNRELRGEIEELQNNQVHEHVITKAETRAKELENMLRMEERGKVVLNNTISKLERKINELSEQVEEERKLSNEQKEAMNQRMRSLKRQLNDAEEEASRRESQFRYTQRELSEERESSSRLQKQLLDLQLQMKRKEAVIIRHKMDMTVTEEVITDKEVKEELKPVQAV